MPAEPVDIEGLLARVARGHSEADVLLVRRAYDLAESSHEGQKRKSGAPYVEHPLAVAAILSERASRDRGHRRAGQGERLG